MKITGASEIIKKLDRVANAAKLKASRSALLQSANVIKRSAALNAKAIDDPNTPNDISKNIAVRFSRKSFQRTGDVTYRVGVAGGAKQDSSKGGKGGDTFYWRFLEFGTQHMAARPFLRPAMDENKQAAVDKFAESMKRSIEREVSKK